MPIDVSSLASFDSNGNFSARPSLFQLIKGKGHVDVQTKNEKYGGGHGKFSNEKFNGKSNGKDGPAPEVTVTDVHSVETEGLSELEIEKINARRMLRVATWSTVFCTSQ